MLCKIMMRRAGPHASPQGDAWYYIPAIINRAICTESPLYSVADYNLVMDLFHLGSLNNPSVMLIYIKQNMRGWQLLLVVLGEKQ